eukprot:TRINITY_DN9952_c0_g1_i8.p2 TRINITY_DN9952_c0_g1~~TRINITY_DN9952_c0_g1_i8.p2  ORF type:complete len:121 (-),score=29.94 TRINITY_DN9952_c0_g1_i8:34-366(-)
MRITGRTLRYVGAALLLLTATNSGAADSCTRGLAYVVNKTSRGSVTVIDNSTGSVVANIPVGMNPSRAVATPDGSRLFVSNMDTASVSVIEIGRAVQQECRDRSRMPSSA